MLTLSQRQTRATEWLPKALIIPFVLSLVICRADCDSRDHCVNPEKSEDASISEINEVGKTSLLANAYRVLSEKRVKRPLYYDAYGHVFLNAFTDKHMEELGEEYGTIVHEMGHRTIWYDSRVKEAIGRGTKQIVFVGSGLDTRPLRIYDPAVTFFELDQEAVLQYKLSRLQSVLGVDSYPSRLVRGNYAEGDMHEELIAVGFDVSQPSLFVWEGNAMYFPKEDAVGMLRMILTNFSNCEVLFDCLGKEVSGLEPPTAETSWFLSLTDFFTSAAGVSSTWVGVCDVEEYAALVPFQVAEKTTLFEIATSFREREELAAMFGSFQRFEETQGWNKYYHYVHAKPI